MDKKAAFVRGLFKEAKHTPTGVYLSFMHHDQLTPKQKADLHQLFLNMLKYRTNTVKMMAGKGDLVELGDSTNFRDDVADAFLNKHPMSDLRTTESRAHIPNPPKGVNAQVVASMDNTAPMDAITEYAKKLQKEYKQRSFLSKLVHREPTTERVFGSSAFAGEREKLFDKHPSQTTYYAHAAPSTDIAKLRKALNLGSDQKFVAMK